MKKSILYDTGYKVYFKESTVSQYSAHLEQQKEIYHRHGAEDNEIVLPWQRTIKGNCGFLWHTSGSPLDSRLDTGL